MVFKRNDWIAAILIGIIIGAAVVVGLAITGNLPSIDTVFPFPKK